MWGNVKISARISYGFAIKSCLSVDSSLADPILQYCAIIPEAWSNTHLAACREFKRRFNQYKENDNFGDRDWTSFKAAFNELRTLTLKRMDFLIGTLASRAISLRRTFLLTCSFRRGGPNGGGPSMVDLCSLSPHGIHPCRGPSPDQAHRHKHSATEPLAPVDERYCGQRSGDWRILGAISLPPRHCQDLLLHI